jgi:predicted AAA+ superfamily ATPase
MSHIVTLDEEDEFVVDGKKVLVHPCWKWLLER